jgi:hypothetical protein
MPMFLLMITTSSAWVISQFTGSAGRFSKQRAIHLGKCTVYGFGTMSGRLFSLFTLPSTARTFILRADHEQNASTSTVRLGPEVYVARAQHEMLPAATIEVRRLAACRRSVAFL